MQRQLIRMIGAFALGVPIPTLASAHAFLDHAVPGVGSTVNGSPRELQLSFTEGVEVALSGVRITSLAGASVPASKPTSDPANNALLHVQLGRALSPGTYVVHWHVVAVDTHPTSGSYKFTVEP